MKNWTLLLLMGLFSVALMTSCSKKDDDDPDTCAEGWETTINDEYQAFVDAAVAYSNSGTTEDCEKYKQALLDYINAIKDLEECYIFIGQQAQWRASVQQSEEEAQMIEC